MLAANHILGKSGFGLFYAAMLAVTVSMAPAMAFMFGLGRALAEIGSVDRRAVAAVTVKVLSGSLRVGAPTAIVAGGLLAWAVRALGFEAWSIAMLLPAVVLVLTATEVMRTAFQSLLLFRYSSVLWITSQGAQFILAASLLLASNTVWPGFLGTLVGAALALLPFVRWFTRQARQPAARATPWSFNLRPEVPLIVSYSLFVLINNADILLAFLLLRRDALNVYAASALLPKAIVTATFPVAQIILPVIVERRAMGLRIRGSLLKGLAMAMAMGAIAAGLLWGILPFLQSSSVGDTGA